MTTKEKDEFRWEPTSKRLGLIRGGHVDSLRQPLIGTMSLRMRSVRPPNCANPNPTVQCRPRIPSDPYLARSRPRDPLKPQKPKRRRRRAIDTAQGFSLPDRRPLRPVNAVEPGGVNGHPPTRRMWCREAQTWYAKPKDTEGIALSKNDVLCLGSTAERLGLSTEEWNEQQEMEFRWWRKRRGGSQPRGRKGWLWNHGTINYSQPGHTSAIPRLLPCHVKGGEPHGEFFETSWMPPLPPPPPDEGPFIPPTPRNDTPPAPH